MATMEEKPPKKDDEYKDDLQYLSGFGNTLQSECLPGALPVGRNNPRIVPYNLYTEQLTGTSFTAPRHENRRTWLYRIYPSVICIGGADADVNPSSNENKTTSSSSEPAAPAPLPPKFFGHCDPSTCRTEVNPMRWKPMPNKTSSSSSSSTTGTTWVDGCHLMCHGGGPSGCATKQGLAIYVYACNRSMNDNASSNNKTTSMSMYNADGDFLIVPQSGRLQVITELGKMHVEPSEICVVPRGMVFQINLLQSNNNINNNKNDETSDKENEEARGYVLEIYNGSSFQLPQLGPIGSNGLANARDFLHPTACCSGFTSQQEYNTQQCEIIVKMNSQLSCKYSNHSPFNVVAWHGNYLAYKYDLKRFCAVNSVSYDHIDPSIYTVLTCPSETLAGTAVADFVIFPPRYLATDDNTLRPPWFHRNTMSEYMGLIHGKYDAKQDFQPGGATLHNCMIPHGPDAASYVKAVADPCTTATFFDGGLAFMFETCFPLQVAPQALLDTSWRDVQYAQCWQNLMDQFTGWKLLEEKASASTAAAATAANKTLSGNSTDNT